MRSFLRPLLYTNSRTGVVSHILAQRALAGALAGALWGAEAFPGEMLEQVIEANKWVYGIDLEAMIERFIETFFV